jgi:hypothetical protein
MFWLVKFVTEVKIMKIATKMIASSAFCLILLAGITSAAQRMVIAEMITNTGCAPCYAADLALDAIADEYAGNLSVIRYHWWYPDASDPYYNFNIVENASRNNYYNNNYSPRLLIDGINDGGYNYSIWESQINQAAQVESPLIMQIGGGYDPGTRAGVINVRIIADQDPGLANLRLRIAVIEDDIHWNAPNGVPVHNQTFRDMIPHPTGRGITIAAGDTVDSAFDFALNEIFDVANCKMIAFVQSNANKQVLQAVRIAVSELTPVSADGGVSPPQAFALRQNFPNPFNSETIIEFETAGGQASLEIFDVGGRRVKILVSERLEAGRRLILWDGRDEAGRDVASGIYFYRLQTPLGEAVSKMTLLR